MKPWQKDIHPAYNSLSPVAGWELQLDADRHHMLWLYGCCAQLELQQRAITLQRAAGGFNFSLNPLFKCDFLSIINSEAIFKLTRLRDAGYLMLDKIMKPSFYIQYLFALYTTAHWNLTHLLSFWSNKTLNINSITQSAWYWHAWYSAYGIPIIRTSSTKGGALCLNDF